jgi:hypothetical protein
MQRKIQSCLSRWLYILAISLHLLAGITAYRSLHGCPSVSLIHPITTKIDPAPGRPIGTIPAGLLSLADTRQMHCLDGWNDLNKKKKNQITTEL